MKTYEVYAVIRATEDTLKNVSLDTIQEENNMVAQLGDKE